MSDEYRTLTINGISKTVREWTKDPICRVKRSTIWSRLRKGWSEHDAVTKPPTTSANTAMHGAAVAGNSHHKLYSIWTQMKIRACNPGSKNYLRQITEGPRIDPAWLTFEGFSQWAASLGWVPGKYILRRVRSAGFTPANCCLTSKAYNGNCTYYAAFGKYQSLSDWMLDPLCKVSISCIRRRVRLGWKFSDAITIPGAIKKEESADYHALIARAARPATNYVRFKKLTLEQRINLEFHLIMRLGGTYGDLARKFGLNVSRVAQIVSGLRSELGLPPKFTAQDGMNVVEKWKKIRGLKQYGGE